jgi:amino acid permease
MEQKTFIYKSQFSYWIFLPAVIFSGLTFYCYQYHSNIAFKGKKIIEFPYSYYLTGILCFLFLIYSIYKFKKHKDSIQNNSTIKISQGVLVFPHKKSTLNVDFKSINELYLKDNSDDGESIIIYSDNSKNRYEFFHDYFESTEKYIEFKTSIEKLVSIN